MKKLYIVAFLNQISFAYREQPKSDSSNIIEIPLKRTKLPAPVSRRFLLPAQDDSGRFLSSMLSSETTYDHEVENAGNYAYMSKFYIGSNRQELRLVLDTGSSLMWVQGNECPNPQECTGQSFDSGWSSTFKPSTTTEEITYG